MAELTAKQRCFVEEYLVDLNATQAAIRAGYSEKTAEAQASRLLTKVNVQELIDELMAERSQRTEITAEKVLQRWWDIATADPNEIIHLRRVCCRHCYGKDHQYQWRDEEEYQQAVKLAVKKAQENEDIIPAIPSNAGGYGFDRLISPNPDCPYCSGEGHSEIHAEDTRHLSSKAKLLFAGIKQTQAGIEIKLQDQGKALENVAKHLGMFTEKHEITGKDGAPIQIIRLEGEALKAKIEELEKELMENAK